MIVYQCQVIIGFFTLDLSHCEDPFNGIGFGLLGEKPWEIRSTEALSEMSFSEIL